MVDPKQTPAGLPAPELLGSAVSVRRALFAQKTAIIVSLSEPTGWGIREAKGG